MAPAFLRLICVLCILAGAWGCARSVAPVKHPPSKPVPPASPGAGIEGPVVVEQRPNGAQRLREEAEQAFRAGDYIRCIDSAVGAMTASEGDSPVAVAGDRLLEGECRLERGQSLGAFRAFCLAWQGFPPASAERAFAARRARALALRGLTASEVAVILGKLSGDLPGAWLGLRLARLAHERGDLPTARARLEAAAPSLERLEEWAWLFPLRQRLDAATESPFDAVGALLPLTGPLRRVGRKALTGLLVASGAFEPYREGGFGVVVYDSAGQPKQAAAGLAGLSEDVAVGAVLGPLERRTARAAATQATTSEISLLTLSVDAGVTGVGHYVFRSFSDSRSEALAAAQYAVARLGLGPIAILRPDHSYGRAMASAFRKAVVAAGGKVVNEASYAPTAVSFKGPLGVLREGPEFRVLYVPDTHQRVVLLSSHLAAAGFVSRPAAQALERSGPSREQDAQAVEDRPVQMIGTGAWYDRQLVAKGGSRYLEGAVFPVAFLAESEEPATIRFANRFLAATGRWPGRFEAFSYDAYGMLVAALGASKVEDRAGLRDRLAALRGWSGVTSTTGFDADRNPLGGPIMVTIGPRGLVAAP